LALDQKWSNFFSSEVSFAYLKAVGRLGESWIGFQSRLSGGIGNLNVTGRIETRGQGLYTLAFHKMLFRGFQFGLKTSYSKMNLGTTGGYSRIFNGDANLTYSGGRFNLGAEYLLNRDLQGDQVLSRPQFSFGLNPIRFYDGFLNLDLRNVLSFSRVLTGEMERYLYSNNTALRIATEPIDLYEGLRLNCAVSLEQFLEKGKRQFTSMGLIFRFQKSLTRWLTIEGFYSYQSRRKTKNWFIEGTMSQDLSLYGRFNLSSTTGGWISFSYDPKAGNWRQSLADLSVGLARNWAVHSLMEYDFLVGKLNNIDLYIIRQIGGFQIRLVWRSLSKQFLIELVPGGIAPRDLGLAASGAR
jgi:hypothetical protein